MAAADAGEPDVSMPDGLTLRDPDPTPEDDPSLPAVEPDERSVGAYIFNQYKVIPPKVQLEAVVLDFDREDEVLARVVFDPGSARPYQWLLLLDKRGERHRVLAEWASLGVDADVRVFSHGRGERALLVIESHGGGASRFEMWTLEASGRLEARGKVVGAEGEVRVDMSRGLPAVQSGARRFQVMYTPRSFVLKEVTR